MKKIEALNAVEIIGKGRNKDEPFSISGHSGLYFYILADHVSQLIKINETYKSLYKTGVEPLENIKIVGRGSISGYRPFLLNGQRYLCIHADHLRQLLEINPSYGKLLEVSRIEEERLIKVEEEREGLEERKRLEEERILEAEGRRKLEELKKIKAEERKLEEKRKLEEIRKEEEKRLEAEQQEKLKERMKAERLIKKVKKLIADAKYIGALKHTPEIMQNIEELFSETEKAFSAGEYENAIELATKTKELIEGTKIETLRKIEELEKPRVEGKYVYCVIPSDGKKKSFGNIGFENAEVYTIEYKDTAVVASDTSAKDYEITEENITTHRNVVGKVMEDYTVAPAAFGQIFKNQRILRAILSRTYRTIKESLLLVDNKIELGVKVVIPKGVTLDKEERRVYASDIIKSINKRAAEAVKGELFSDRLLLNASFLVDRDVIEEFSSEIKKLNERYDFLKTQYSGPWPPYNFVEIRIGT